MSKPLFWSKTAFLFLLRSGRPTIVLSFMVLVSVCALVFLSSLAVGVNDAMVRNSVGLYSGHITGVDLPAALAPQDLVTDGVRGVLKRTDHPAIISIGKREFPAVVVSVDVERELDLTALSKKTLEGRYPEAGSVSIFISTYAAEGLKARPGDKVDVLAAGEVIRGLLVSGIYKTGVDQIDRNLVFVPAGVILDKEGVWQASVFLEDGAPIDEITSGYSKLLKGEGTFKTWSELMPDLRELIDLNYVSMSVVMVIVFLVVAIGIASSFSIFILRHMREYGLMKAMGVTGLELTLLILLEIAIMDIIATVAGIIAGGLITLIYGSLGIDLGAFTSHNRYFSVSGVVYPRLTLYSVALPAVLSFFFGLLSAVWPAIQLGRKRAAEILRSV